MQKGISYIPSNFDHEQRTILSQRLIYESKLKNGKVFYTNGGADSNEVACFITKEYHYLKNNIIKTNILSFEKSFHGGSTLEHLYYRVMHVE